MRRLEIGIYILTDFKIIFIENKQNIKLIKFD